MSWQNVWKTTRTFTFKIKVQMPFMSPSNATLWYALPAANVLGIYNKHSPLIKFDPEFLTLAMLGKHSLTALDGWFLRWDNLASFAFKTLLGLWSSFHLSIVPALVGSLSMSPIPLSLHDGLLGISTTSISSPLSILVLERLHGLL